MGNVTKHVELEDRVDNGYGSLLLCPRCGGPNLHHGPVDVYECREDRPGLHASIGGGKVAVDENMSGNPSSRRHGLTIGVECEHCGAESLLGLEQHKGETFLNWLSIGQEKPRT